jgi:hypothetical protein
MYALAKTQDAAHPLITPTKHTICNRSRQYSINTLLL